MSAQYDCLFKLLIVGESGVGKSSILSSFMGNKFTEAYTSTIGVDFKIKTIDVDGSIAKLQIWDTAGQERFRSITSSYYRGAHGIVVVYDVTNLDSFNSVPSVWLKEVENLGWPGVKKILVANKIDMEDRRVSAEEGEQLANTYGMKYVEASAKSGDNIARVFELIAREIKEAVEAGGLSGTSPTSPMIKSKPVGDRSGCC